MYKVKEVANLVGVSVRTLHHYDQINLLKPESVTLAGYRLYTDENLEKLQQILFFKEVGFSLDEIKEIINRPEFDRLEALRRHKEILLKKRERLTDMIQTVEHTIHSIDGGYKMENKDLFKGFSMKEIEEHQAKYRDEAREKYGEAIVEKTEKRTSSYTKEDWESIQSTTNTIYRKIAERMPFGPKDEKVQEAVAEWRQFITDHFYDCTLEIFRGLGDLYVQDERFTKNIDLHAEGLAAFLREAMHIYCDHHKN